ncbi:Asparagine synthase [Magnetospirillum gryphiswaldense MSR-1 v2]|uniref:asparagine synthase (glutamine-hydrolyzing) n=1 Tax=Magnetospirillum gryphiswaldense (strain DSM 6361 / JCM 21280 / NBRC 15271 / MSR-1) TaxID=431944 RepID=V6F5P2_MAGGM|nr:asparagine synthase (glutamine-hydrolyzing) [Magnetospirillum gryphiswaldense]CDL00702.1 Asparagine synthase [Magnetospirillum gryphiswaldense MSR-1 v2]
MCGIAGSTRTNPDLLRAMNAAMAHRGPDAQAIWHENGVGLAHARLAIIDLTPGGAQPMVSPCGRWVIAFNGEIYNHHHLRAELEVVGEHFSSTSDTEVLLRLLMRGGKHGLDKLIGMFALALWDRRDQSLLLVRDRLGVKPLVWASLPDGGIAFASEIDTLRRQPGLDLGLDRQALSEYLACLYVPAPRTLHAGIRKLLPGHWLEWKDGAITTGSYWAPAYTGERSISLDEAAEEVLPLLDSAVRLRMVADVEVGCFLSGGIDSSVIAALMSRAAKESGAPPVRSFTMTFDEPAYDERVAARAVAEHVGTIHTELPARPVVTDLLDDMVRAFGEPFGNPTALLIHDLSTSARQHLKVALVGDGGDEVFAGYPRHHGGLLAERYRRLLPGPLRALAGTAAQLIPESTSGRHAWRRAREFLSAGTLPADQMYASWVEYFDPEERQAMLGLETLPSRPIADLYRQAPSASALDAMQQTDLLSFLPGNLLSYGDAMSMAVALELRHPFLDHRLIDCVGRMAAATRFAGGKKAILKQVARRLLPSHIIDRPKLGFNPPMGVWLKTDLATMVAERLTRARMGELGLDWTAIARLLAEHQGGRRDHSLKVWALLVLEAWERGQKQP